MRTGKEKGLRDIAARELRRLGLRITADIWPWPAEPSNPPTQLAPKPPSTGAMIPPPGVPGTHRRGFGGTGVALGLCLGSPLAKDSGDELVGVDGFADARV
jgi:hypothetical protein